MNKQIEELYKKQHAEKEKIAIANIPGWIERGKNIIFKERHAEWEKCVQERSLDIYHGEDLDAALEIMEALENNIPMEEVIAIFNEQMHSACSQMIVRDIIFNFCIKGPEFFEATSYGELPLEHQEIIENKKQENEKLIQLNFQRQK